MTAETENQIEILWQDDFSGGFDHGTIGSDSKWASPVLAGYVPADGLVMVTEDGIRVTSRGTNPDTGEPAFTLTQPQNLGTDGTPGELDHLKWLSFANNVSSAGIPGFDVPEGCTISFECVVGGRTFGAADHPFGDNVSDPDADPRLATAVMVASDLFTGMGFDFFLTNNRIYAGYERVRFARPRFGNYAAFLFSVPVAERSPDDVHRLKMSYDRAMGSVTWFIDGTEVLKVDRIGASIDRAHIVLDKGGEDQVVEMNQVVCGLGLMSLLDGALGGGRPLVNLSGMPVDFDTARGEPALPNFVDDQSRESSRLFGQGAELTCQSYRVYYE